MPMPIVPSANVSSARPSSMAASLTTPTINHSVALRSTGVGLSPPLTGPLCSIVDFGAVAAALDRQGVLCVRLGLNCFAEGVRFQHYGVDVAVEDIPHSPAPPAGQQMTEAGVTGGGRRLRPVLFEINKGPDMKHLRTDVVEGLADGHQHT